jgi:opacity protein-like surface antigen
MKKVLLSMAALSIISSTAMAAPITDLQKDESIAGYSYWNTKIEADGYDFGKTGSNGFYVETGINDKFIVGIETMKGSKSGNVYGVGVSADTRFTDISLKYKIDKNVQIIAGNRNYDSNFSGGGYSLSSSTNKFFYGVGVNTEIGESTSAYASILHSNIADDWQVGVNHTLNKNVILNVNYRYYDDDYFTLKGLGAGVAYKF